MQPFVGSASAYHNILFVEESRTSSAFTGAPLALLSPKARGEIIATAVRGVIADQYPNAQISEAVAGSCMNGRSRSFYQAEYDWLCDGRRVECKSAQMAWKYYHNRWGFLFRGIKVAFTVFRTQALFDELVLALYTPHNIYVYRHDLVLGLSTAGVATGPIGHVVSIVGPVGERDWSIAVGAILSKLDAQTNNCTHIADFLLTDCRIEQAVASHTTRSHHIMEPAYRNVPLAELSPVVRAIRMQELARAVDSERHGSSCIKDALVGARVDGGKRGQYQAEYDWIRGSLRIECKSARLLWNDANTCWRLTFVAIKLEYDGVRASASFDELILVVYTPRGIYMYQQDQVLGVSSHGKLTSSCGFQISLSGPRRQFDWAASLDAILHKLDNSGCNHIAFISW